MKIKNDYVANPEQVSNFLGRFLFRLDQVLKDVELGSQILWQRPCRFLLSLQKRFIRLRSVNGDGQGRTCLCTSL
jgi:hypothetical protein